MAKQPWLRKNATLRHSHSTNTNIVKNTEQVDLFGEVETAGVSINESARRLRVSSATVRNWLKTGYLKSAGLGQITETSLDHFQDQVVGTEKLNQRANKSSKDSHDHEALAIRFLVLVGDGAKPDFLPEQNQTVAQRLNSAWIQGQMALGVSETTQNLRFGW